MTIRLLSIALLLGFAAISHADGSFSPVAGSLLSVIVSPAGTTLTWKSKDNSVDSGSFGSDGDPRCDGVGGGGASLRVNGGPGNDFTIVLPCEGWRTPNGSPTSLFNTDYSYRDHSGATCKEIVVKHGHFIHARCRGPQVAYTLGAPQGNVDVTLRLGTSPARNCTTFGPLDTVVRDGSDGKKYLVKHAPPPMTCNSL